MKYSVFGIPRAKIFLLEFYLQKPLVRFCSPFVVLRSCFALLSIQHTSKKLFTARAFFSDFHNRLLADQHTSFRFAIRDWHPGSDLGLLYLCFPYQNKEIRKEIELDDSHPLLLLSLIISFSFYLNRDTTKEMLINTKSQITEASNRQLPMRVLLWTDLVNQIGHETLRGYGFNSYPAINPIHQSKEVRERRSIGLDNAHNPYTPLIGRGHSDFLEFISEFGIPFSCCSSFSDPRHRWHYSQPSPFPKIILSAVWLSYCIF